jgi:hypothetical protein
MPKPRIDVLREVVRVRHPEVHASLQQNKEDCSGIAGPLLDWYQWQNGQEKETQVPFLNWYRFISLQEAQQQLKRDRDYLGFVPACSVGEAMQMDSEERMLYSLPLLQDDAGEGYYFCTLSHRAYYMLYGKEDRFFAFFDSFVDFLIELATSPFEDIFELLGAEWTLLDRYTQR